MIAVTDSGGFVKIDADQIDQAMRREFGDTETWKVYSDFDSMLPDKENIEIILNNAPLNPAKLDQFQNLRWVFSYSAGIDRYPLRELSKMGVVLTNTSGVQAKPIAEQVFGAMIMFSRNLITAFQNQAARAWDQTIPVSELADQNLLVVGAGAIGREIARKAKAFDMHVTGIRNHLTDELPTHFDAMFTMNSLESLIPQAHYVVSVLPSTEATRGLFDISKFELMNPEAVFINVGRGDLTVEGDLICALREKTIKGAYLDVFTTEPVPKDSPLWDLDNLLMTPHNSGPSQHYFKRAFAIFVQNLRRYRRGEPLVNQINYELKY